MSHSTGNRSDATAPGYVVEVKSDTVGAFVRDWARHTAEWRERGLARAKYEALTPALESSSEAIVIKGISSSVRLGGNVHRRGIIPLAYPRNLPANQALSAIGALYRMTCAATVCEQKPIFEALEATDELDAFMSVILLVSGARAGIIAAFNDVPISAQCDLAARYAAEYSRSTRRIVLRGLGGCAAEDLWIQQLRTAGKAGSKVVETLSIAASLGPYLAMAYAIMSRGDAQSVVADMAAQNAWSILTAKLADQPNLVLSPPWVRRAVLFESARWMPEVALYTIAGDPAIGVACLRASLEDEAEIAASREQEAHIRMTASTTVTSMSPSRRSPPQDDISDPSPATSCEMPDDVFGAPTPMPGRGRTPHAEFAFSAFPRTVAAPFAIRPHRSPSIGPHDHRAPSLSPRTTRAFGNFAQNVLQESAPITSSPAQRAPSPPIIWGAPTY